MTEPKASRIAGALKEILFAQERAVEAAITLRRRQHLRLLIAGALLVLAGSGGLGAMIGGHAAARPLIYVALFVTPLCLVYYGFLLGRAVGLKQEINRIRATLGTLAVAAQDANLSATDTEDLGARFSSIDALMLQARKVGLN
ncbi:MAG: hypothetical protein GC152_05935 [Alphaproteobacteria bacterium]|nr:hypothetical protein [Alphaproteobacteria bacterium]